jgi:hypothetical protein
LGRRERHINYIVVSTGGLSVIVLKGAVVGYTMLALGRVVHMEIIGVKTTDRRYSQSEYFC